MSSIRLIIIDSFRGVSMKKLVCICTYLSYRHAKNKALFYRRTKLSKYKKGAHSNIKEYRAFNPKLWMDWFNPKQWIENRILEKLAAKSITDEPLPNFLYEPKRKGESDSYLKHVWHHHQARYNQRNLNYLPHFQN